jgi:hypothetical protein
MSPISFSSPLSSCLRPAFAAALVMVWGVIGDNKSSFGEDQKLLAGAAIVDVSPPRFPIAVNGNMTVKMATSIETPVNARAIVLAQGDSLVAMVVIDSCMIPRDLCDEIKAMASKATGVAADRIMISATHTHTAPAAMSCLGTDADPEYRAYLRVKVTEAIAAAKANLVPARVGFGSIDARHYMAVRQWVRRPDRIASDPFGNPTVRANMHAGRVWEDVTGEAGPEDPELSMISLQTLQGEPIAVLSNLSMHYFSGVSPISADYFGLYSDALAAKLTGDKKSARPIVGIMSHGCSGDIWRVDYTKQTPPEFETIKIDQYVSGLIELSMRALAEIRYDESPRLEMAETRFRLSYRVPDAQLLQWSKGIVEKLEGKLPTTTEEVYAREQILLHEAQSTEVVVQAIRIGDIGIATTPNETYALTGLKLKLQSPLKQTMVIELANGGDGYIPPPEQHPLGGYNTWPARSAGLEEKAEPKITEAALAMLERVAGKSRVPYLPPFGPLAKKVIDLEPLGYWRMDDMAGPRARDQSKHRRDGHFEPGVLFFLEGARSELFTSAERLNRAAHFAGGRMTASVGTLPDRYSVSMWVWNGMPIDGRGVTGWAYARGKDYARPEGAEQLGLGGTSGHAGKLILQVGEGPVVGGTTEVKRWSWNHLLLVRDGGSIRVFLNGDPKPEIEVTGQAIAPAWADELFFGGSSRGDDSWEGRLDEVAVFPAVIDPKTLIEANAK